MAISKKHRKTNISNERHYKTYIKKMQLERKRTLIDIHKKYSYTNGSFEVPINKDFGLEDENNFNYFIEIASKIIDFDSKELILGLEKCQRVWPSAVTLMCSLKEWVEFGVKYNKINHPFIASSDPGNSSVDAYLTHCGFYKYC